MRDIIFKSIFFFGALFICILFLPSLLMPKKIVLFGGKLMGYWAGFCLEFFMSTKIIIKGRENIINSDKFFNIWNRYVCTMKFILNHNLILSLIHI